VDSPVDSPVDRPARVRDIVQARVDKVNAELARFEQIRKFRVMEVPLTVASGLLTTTLKVKRKKVWETFKRELDGLYEEAAAP